MEIIEIKLATPNDIEYLQEIGRQTFYETFKESTISIYGMRWLQTPKSGNSIQTKTVGKKRYSVHSLKGPYKVKVHSGGVTKPPVRLSKG